MEQTSGPRRVRGGGNSTVESRSSKAMVAGSNPSASSARIDAGGVRRRESSQFKETGWCLLARVRFLLSLVYLPTFQPAEVQCALEAESAGHAFSVPVDLRDAMSVSPKNSRDGWVSG